MTKFPTLGPLGIRETDVMAVFSDIAQVASREDAPPNPGSIRSDRCRYRKVWSRHHPGDTERRQLAPARQSKPRRRRLGDERADIIIEHVPRLDK